MEKGEIYLRVTSLSKSFGNRKVIDSLKLDVRRGETFCVLGPSGCGKTTLLRIIAGLEAPDDGSIELDGTLAVAEGKSRISPRKRNLGFVFQDLALWPHLTVAGNLDFVLKSIGTSKAARRERIRRTLDLVRLTGFETAYPETLSGGEQQRLAIARALVGNPSLVLLDEPLSSLDYQLKRRLRHELVTWLKALAVTAMWVTHDQTEAMAVGDRLAVMFQGQFAQIGIPDEVRRHPLPAVEEFLSGLFAS